MAFGRVVVSIGILGLAAAAVLLWLRVLARPPLELEAVDRSRSPVGEVEQVDVASAAGRVAPPDDAASGIEIEPTTRLDVVQDDDEAADLSCPIFVLSDGGPVEGARIDVSDWTGRSRLASATTDALGRATVSMRDRHAALWIFVDHPGYLPQRVFLERHAPETVVTLEGGRTVTAVVRDHESAAPVPNTPVRVSVKDFGMPLVRYTDAGGAFEVTVPEPDAELEAEWLRAGHAVSSPETAGGIGLVPFEVRSGDESLQLELVRGFESGLVGTMWVDCFRRCEIRGTVIDPAGRPVPDAFVRLIETDREPLTTEPRSLAMLASRHRTGALEMRMTDDRGRFTHRDLTPGASYTAHVYHDDGRDAISEVIHVDRGRVHETIIEMSEDRTGLFLRVLDEHGLPCDDLHVGIQRDGTAARASRHGIGWPYSGETPDAEGVVSFPILSPGTYDVVLGRQGTRIKEIRIDVPGPGPTEIDVEFGEREVLHGKVTDAAGVPVPHARVAFYDGNDETPLASQMANDEGEFRLTRLPAGPGALHVWDGRHQFVAPGRSGNPRWQGYASFVPTLLESIRPGGSPIVVVLRRPPTVRAGLSDCSDNQVNVIISSLVDPEEEYVVGRRMANDSAVVAVPVPFIDTPFALRFESATTNWTAAGPLVAAAGQMLELGELVPDVSSGSVDVLVVDQDGAPISARLELCRGPSRVAVDPAVDGRVELSGLPRGEYVLDVEESALYGSVEFAIPATTAVTLVARDKIRVSGSVTVNDEIVDDVLTFDWSLGGGDGTLFERRRETVATTAGRYEARLAPGSYRVTGSRITLRIVVAEAPSDQTIDLGF